jgi:hypothetical protein
MKQGSDRPSAKTGDRAFHRLYQRRSFQVRKKRDGGGLRKEVEGVIVCKTKLL